MFESVKTTRLILTAFLAISFAFPTFASNLTSRPAQYSEAVQSYKDKKYSQSLAQFKRMHDAGMCNDMVHYYMALCYQSLSQIAAAKSEYYTVARSKNAALRQNAQYALASLDQWNQHRLYQGNGNNFSRYSTARSGGSSFSSSYRPPPLKEITIEMTPPAGGRC